MTKAGKLSDRCDGCVRKFAYAVAEFDGAPKTDQLRFWVSILQCETLDLAAIIDSGGKSLHGWVRAGCSDAEEWTAKVEGDLFPNLLVPLGVDPACRNESRMSRMPGHFRSEKGNWQRLLYLNPGRAS